MIFFERAEMRIRMSCTSPTPASKLLSLTGWRVGWLTGPKDLIAPIRTIHSYVSFCPPTPLPGAPLRRWGPVGVAAFFLFVIVKRPPVVLCPSTI